LIQVNIKGAKGVLLTHSNFVSGCQPSERQNTEGAGTTISVSF
jgi:hypothetical protein